jgi:hypothetical protein
MTKRPSASGRQWILTLLILLVGAALIYAVYRRKANWNKDHVLLELKAVQNAQGWGYVILENGHVFIHQDIIPAIPGAHAFHSREDALAVGQKVVDRLAAGQMPMVTAAEIKGMRILPDSVLQNDSSTRK